MSIDKITSIQNQAVELGFDIVGFTADFSPKYKEYFLSWLHEGKHADMNWLNNNQNLRCEPNTILENTKSVILFALSYNHDSFENKDYKIARYAFGKDYHHWIKDKLVQLGSFIQNKIDPEFQYRAFVDTGPVLERDLATKAGLGWIGKNTCLINKKLGSYVFLSVMFCNQDFTESKSSSNHCGSCQRCLDICPTKALSPYKIDASKCLAYQNIERRGERDRKYWDKMGEWLVGCDLCQDVCPWNEKAPQTRCQTWLDSIQENQHGSLSDLLDLDEVKYKEKFKKTPLSRIHYHDFMRNVFIVIANSKKKELLKGVLTWQKRNPDQNLAELERCLDVLMS